MLALNNSHIIKGSGRGGEGDGSWDRRVCCIMSEKGQYKCDGVVNKIPKCVCFVTSVLPRDWLNACT